LNKCNNSETPRLEDYQEVFEHDTQVHVVTKSIFNFRNEHTNQIIINTVISV